MCNVASSCTKLIVVGACCGENAVFRSLDFEVPLSPATCKMSKEWSNGLCGCLNDIPLCLTTYCAPCYTFGKTAEAVGDDCLMCGIITFVPLVNLWFATQIRGKIREQKGIDGSFVSDLLLHCCCPLCTLVQDALEVGVKAPFGNSMARS